MENVVKDIQTWYSQNMLMCNDSKTEILVINSKHKPISDFLPLSVGDCMIRPLTKVNDLGVVVDNHLTLTPHVNNIVQSAFFKIRDISYNRKYLTPEASKTLVHAFVTSRLDYCNSVLYGIPKQHLDKLQSVLNTAARLVTQTRKYDHISPVLKKLHWLPIQQRMRFKILLLVYKSLNGIAPQYLRNKLKYKQNNGLRSDNTKLLVIPNSNLKTYGDRSFSVAGPKLWNILPQSLRTCKSLEMFKSQLKTLLFKEAFLNYVT